MSINDLSEENVGTRILNQAAEKILNSIRVGGPYDIEFLRKFKNTFEIVDQYAGVIANRPNRKHEDIIYERASFLPYSMGIIKNALKDYAEMLIELDLLDDEIKSNLASVYMMLNNFLPDEEMEIVAKRWNLINELQMHAKNSQEVLAEKTRRELVEVYKKTEKYDNFDMKYLLSRTEFYTYIDNQQKLRNKKK